MPRLRHLAPSALTATGIAFAALSVQSSVDGQHRTAAWLAMLSVLTDRLDGAAARALKASSAFGAQLDSFADFFSFGIAPATLFYAFFATHPALGWTEPVHRALLAALSFFYLLAVAARLARFNITHGIPGAERFFFGIPTTYTGGMLVAAFALLLKYGDPSWIASDPGSDRFYVFGRGTRLDAAMALFPWVLAPAAVGMVSTFRMPKVGRTRWRSLDLVQSVAAGVGYIAGLLRYLPEYLLAGGAVYLGASIAFHVRSRSRARDVRLPHLFADVERREREAARATEPIADDGGETQAAGGSRLQAGGHG